MTVSARHQAFFQLYDALKPGNTSAELLRLVYADDVIFIDPFHQKHGIDELEVYFTGLYENVTEIRFNFGRVIEQDNHSCVQWLMTFKHPALQKGQQEIDVNGVTLIEWQNDKIVRHQDVFDGGEMLYQHIPVLGWAINKIKDRMQ
ncbi:MAG: nuclear transport factor 2 family protein [Oleibacter sp.]|nr:nuclear transport factor 2 family protein [Thalassolituus sp.]